MNQSKRKFKGVLSGFMATALTASFLPLPEAKASNFYDVNSYDWYATSVARWSTAGVIHGTGDNLYSPDANVTRGQIAVMINNIMGYEVESQALFTDLLDPSKYYYTPLRYLAAAGVVNGRDNGTMGAEDDVTREEAALMLCKAFYLELSDKTYTNFADNSDISDYAMEYVVTLSEMGVMNGTPDKMVMPKGNLTRAEFATMLNALITTLTYHNGNAVTSSINTANIGGTTIVNTDTTVSGTTIHGDLILAPGVSYGDVYLDDLSITGNVYVRGGGVESVYVNDVEILGDMKVGRDKDPVRVVFAGTTKASTLGIQSDCIIDNTALSTDGYVSDLVVESGENIEIIGVYDTLVNDTTGANITIDGSVSEITMNASGTINGVAVAPGTSFDSNSIPGLDIEEPNITLTHNYGTAVNDVDNDPYAESEVMTIEYDATTGEVVATIRVEDEEDCALMAEAQNAITIYNPNDLSSLNSLELAVERKDYSSYTEFEVSFTLTQNYSEIPLSVNFKDEYASPEVNIILNYNDLPKASAEYEVEEISYSASTGTAKGVLNLSDIKYCEPHYLDEYVITYDEKAYEDLEFSVTKQDYDDEEATSEISFEFNGDAVDSIDLTVNFLKTDAQDEIPTVKSYFYHDDDEGYESRITPNYVLNAQGLMEVELDIKLDNDWQLVSGSKAVTVDADSGEEEYGYGLDFDYELTHDGANSHYVITFAPDSTIEEVTFLVHVEKLDENIPEMTVAISEPRFEIADYAQINMNTRTFSRSQVTVEVAVDEEAIEEITGFELSNDVFVPYVYTEEKKEEVSSYSVTKLEDGLYQIKFEPVVTTTSNGESDTISSLKTYLCLDLAQTDDYIGLYPVQESVEETHGYDTKASVPAGNLAYAVKAVPGNHSLTTGTDTTTNFDYYATVTYVSTTKLQDYFTNGAGFVYDGETGNKNLLPYHISLRLEDSYKDEEGETITDSWDNYLESMYIQSVTSTPLTAAEGEEALFRNQVKIYFESKPKVDPEDIRLNVYNVSASSDIGADVVPEYQTPTVTILDKNGAGQNEVTATAKVVADSGEVTVTLTGLNTGIYDYGYQEHQVDGKTNLDGGITVSNSTSTISFKLTEEWKTTDSSKKADISIKMIKTAIPPTINTVEGIVNGSSITETVTFGDVEEDETQANTYTTTVTIPSDYELDLTVTDEKLAFSFGTGNNVPTITEAVKGNTAEGKTTYTLTLDVENATFLTNLTLTVALQYSSAPAVGDFATLSGFKMEVGTEGNPATIKRKADALEAITWELTSYTAAAQKGDEPTYELTTVDLGLTLDEATVDTKTIYYSNGQSDEQSNGQSGWAELNNHTLDALVDGEVETFFFSFNKNGNNALKVEISADVAYDTAGEVKSTEDIFMLSTKGIEASEQTIDALKNLMKDDGFSYFSIKTGTTIDASLIFANGLTLILDSEFTLTDESKSIIVRKLGILIYKDTTLYTADNIANLVTISYDEDYNILLTLAGTVSQNANLSETLKEGDYYFNESTNLTPVPTPSTPA